MVLNYFVRMDEVENGFILKKERHYIQKIRSFWW